MAKVQNMTRTLQLFIGVAACVFLPFFAQAAESISRYEVDLTVFSDATLEVTETITYDFGAAERRGIFRSLPEQHHQQPVNPQQRRTIDYEITEVTRNGTEEPFATYAESDSLVVKIGYPDVTITGPHTYTISYTVNGGLSYFDIEPPELYWDAVGVDWPVAIDEAVVTLYDPDNVFRDPVSCYSGAYGLSTSCEQMAPNVFRVTNLAPNEGVTIAQALDETAVATVVLTSINWLPILLGCVLVLLAGGGYVLYRIKTIHKMKRSIIAQYEPYPDVLPMYTGVLRDGRLDPRDITAGFIYLASEGFISISSTTRKVLWLFDTDDHEVNLERPLAEAPTNFHQSLLEMLFADKAVGATVSLAEIAKSQSQVRANVRKKLALDKAVRKDLLERGFYEQPLSLPGIVKNLSFSSVPVIIAIFIFGALAAILFVPLLFVIITTVAILHRRRTKKGYEALYYLQGFEEYLSVTGKGRFKFHNAPDKNPQTFLEYLPYAVALGVEEEWAEVFKDITIPEPAWYHGNNSGTRSFAATDLTNNLGAFSAALATSTSSSGSNSSGSGGGGFSGGGSGGGGGGSW